MNREKQNLIAGAINSNEPDRIYDTIIDSLVGEKGKNNIRYFENLASFVDSGVTTFRVFSVDGNVKLPFASFSSLPGASFCPGAGDCLNWCYSFRAWRYPAAFARQAQNQILLQSEDGRERILQELDKLEPADGSRLDFRLYVDGDFTDFTILDFWMRALIARPWLRAYGYSKSFELFLRYHERGHAWPGNYVLNLSGGHRYPDHIVDRMRALPITRGSFLALPIGRKVKSADHGTRETNAAIRRVHGGKVFPCPGKCGECTPRGHACGSKRFAGIDIAIAVH